MHSLIFSVVPRKDGHALSLESFYDSGYPWYADYVEEVDDEQQKLDAIKALCDAFPFCTRDVDDPFMLHIDHKAAHAALLHQYREASGMYAKLAAGEYVPYGFEYAAELAAAGDDYGLHVLGYNSADMNDLKFTQFCADEKRPDMLYVKYICDYHC